MMPKRSQSVSNASSAPSMIEGILEKKKTFGSSKCHCFLRDGKLWYCEDKSRESFIDISHAQSIREGKARITFEIITSSRTHTFTAESQSLRDKWLACLREAMRSPHRKNSALSYIENTNSDEEPMEGGSPQRSHSAFPMKAGSASTLPPSMSSRQGPVKPIFREDPKFEPSRISSQMRDSATNVVPLGASKSFGGPQIGKMRQSSRGGSIEEEKGEEEAKACSVVETKTACVNNKDEKITEINANKVTDASNLSVNVECRDKNRVEPPRDSVHVRAGETGIVQRTEEDGSTIVCMTPSTLYANKEGARKLSVENETEKQVEAKRENSSENDDASAKLQESVGSTEVESPSEPTKEQSFETDDVFPPTDENFNHRVPKTPETRPAVMRRQSRRNTSEPDPVQIVIPEPAEVELDVDFQLEPVPDLPHPSLDATWSSAFAEIRSFLSENFKSKVDEDVLAKSVFKDQPGSAVDSLKHFLETMERG